MALLLAFILGALPPAMPSQPFHAVIPSRIPSIDRPSAPKGNRAGRRRDAKLGLE
jgi:hypothetical protein